MMFLDIILSRKSYEDTIAIVMCILFYRSLLKMDNIFSACYNGDIKYVKKFVNSNRNDINKKNHNGNTLLHIACKCDIITCGSNLSCNHFDIAKLLIDNGANVNEVNDSHYTVLHEACCHWNNNIVKLLLNNGANMYAIGGNDKTCLHSAILSCNKKMVKILLEHDANVVKYQNLSNTLLSCALHSACDSDYSQSDIIETLLGYNADVNEKNSDGDTPLHVASMTFHKLARALLKSKADVNAKNNNGDTPLHIAYEHRNYTMVELLIEHGADINATNNNNLTPIMLKKEYR